jgi:hypothetical protein
MGDKYHAQMVGLWHWLCDTTESNTPPPNTPPSGVPVPLDLRLRLLLAILRLTQQ